MEATNNFDASEFEARSGRGNHSYGRIFDNVSDGVIVFDVCEDGSFRVIEINPAFEVLTGFTRNQLLGKTYEDVMMGEIPKEINENFRRCTEQIAVIKIEMLLDLPTGRRPYRLTFVPVVGENNRANQIVGIVRVLTVSDRAEEVLKEKNKHTQALLRLSRNLERAQTYGEIVDAALEEVKAVIGYQNLWVYLLTEDKKYADLLTAGGIDSEVVVPRLTVTGDKMIEEIVSAPNYVLVEDARTDERTNKEIVAQLKNRTIVNVPIVFFGRHMGSVGMGTFGDEGIRVPTDTEREFLMALASHMAVSLDRVHSILERKRAEEALRRTNIELEEHRHNLEALVEERTRELSQARDAAESSNRAKSIFLANMSHELRTPLNAILGFTQLINKDNSISESAKKNLSIINRSGEHLLSMINDVLDLSKIEAGKVELKEESFDLVRTVEDVGEMIRARVREKHLEVIVDIDPDIQRYIKADLGKIRQILINLLGNAVKFTDYGGIAIIVSTVNSSDNPSAVMLDVKIKDTGCGIPEDKLVAIFTPFTQVGSTRTSLAGTGLGLTISRSFAQMMGGRITVMSEEGKGSVFSLQVPVKVVSKDAVYIIDAPRLDVVGLEDGEPEYRVLIVEDNADNAELLESLLAQVGLIVKVAVNGEEGVRAAEEWRPHFIWMDMKMPVMDGYEATRCIRSRPWGRDVVIMAFTASVFSDQESKIIDAGCNGIIHKPFREQEIFDAMAEHLGIRFKYSKQQDNKTVSGSGIDTNIDMLFIPSAEDVRSLSKETTERILKATADLDKLSILAIADELAGTNRSIAIYLKNHASSYNFEAIERLMKSTDSKKAS